ncbi:MAG: hypothetical protein ABNH00_09065 [Dokdonia sp.]
MIISHNNPLSVGTIYWYHTPSDLKYDQDIHINLMWLIRVQSSIGGWNDCPLAET